MDETIKSILEVMKKTGADEISVSGDLGKNKRITVSIKNKEDEEEE